MNNTYLTTQLTDISQKIKQLDVDALKLAQSAKAEILQATSMACNVGSLLKEAQELTGRSNYLKWLEVTFGHDFIDRAKRYRKAYDDPRQMALSMGVIPNTQKALETTDQPIKAKPDRNIVYINKLTGYLRTAETISNVDRVALQGIIAQLRRHGLV